MPTVKKTGKRKKPSSRDLIKPSETEKKSVVDKINKWKIPEREKFFEEIGIGSSYFTCSLCGKPVRRGNFHQSTDPNSVSKVSRVCKECANNIAFRKDEYGDLHEPTKQSIMEALEYLDKPFLETVFDSSVVESSSDEVHWNLWTSYIKNISMPQYDTLRWRDSDNFKRMYRAVELGRPQDISKQEAAKNDEAIINYEINRKDCIRLIGYDPFINYPREDEKPILYANLVSFIDEETKNDGMKLNAVIQIVKKFSQAEKLNDQLDMYINDVQNAANNMPLINKIADSSKKLMDVANALAKDNGINKLVPVWSNPYEKNSLNCWEPLRVL